MKKKLQDFLNKERAGAKPIKKRVASARKTRIHKGRKYENNRKNDLTEDE